MHTRQAAKYMYANEEMKSSRTKKGKEERETAILMITRVFAPMKAIKLGHNIRQS